jgi:hypothetical protein
MALAIRMNGAMVTQFEFIVTKGVDRLDRIACALETMAGVANISDVTEECKKLKTTINQLAVRVIYFATELENTWESEEANPFEKAQRLRNVIKDMRVMASGYLPTGVGSPYGKESSSTQAPLGERQEVRSSGESSGGR